MGTVTNPCSSGARDSQCARWSLNLTSDLLTDGRRCRTLNAPDDYNCQLLGVEIDFFLPASRVVQVLTRLVDCHGRPAQLRPDNGPKVIRARLS